MSSQHGCSFAFVQNPNLINVILDKNQRHFPFFVADGATCPYKKRKKQPKSFELTEICLTFASETVINNKQRQNN